MINSIVGNFANEKKTEEYFEAAQEHLARLFLNEKEEELKEMLGEFESHFGTTKFERNSPEDVTIILIRRHRQFHWSRSMLGPDPTTPSAIGKDKE